MCKCALYNAHPTEHLKHRAATLQQATTGHRPPQGTGHNSPQATSRLQHSAVVPCCSNTGSPQAALHRQGVALLLPTHTPAAKCQPRATGNTAACVFPARLESLNSSTCSGSQESAVRRPRVQAVQAGRGRKVVRRRWSFLQNATVPYRTKVT